MTQSFRQLRAWVGSGWLLVADCTSSLSPLRCEPCKAPALNPSPTLQQQHTTSITRLGNVLHVGLHQLDGSFPGDQKDEQARGSTMDIHHLLDSIPTSSTPSETTMPVISKPEEELWCYSQPGHSVRRLTRPSGGDDAPREQLGWAPETRTLVLPCRTASPRDNLTGPRLMIPVVPLALCFSHASVH